MQVQLDLSTMQASPGQDIDITISSKPNSYIGLLGVDQSVLLLRKGNDLEESQVFNELGEYSKTANSTNGSYSEAEDFQVGNSNWIYKNAT